MVSQGCAPGERDAAVFAYTEDGTEDAGGGEAEIGLLHQAMAGG